MSIVQRREGESRDPTPPFDVRTLVLLVCAGGAVWVGIFDPLLAGAVGFGLYVLAWLHKFVSK
jgi:hypothetical protein